MLLCGSFLDLSVSVISVHDTITIFYHIASNTEGSQHINVSNIYKSYS